jgi:hypothetical protein
MAAQDGRRRRCCGDLRPRGNFSRTRSLNGRKCCTLSDAHPHIRPLRAMPWKNGCRLRSRSRPARASPVFEPQPRSAVLRIRRVFEPQPRCAVARIRGMAPERWPDRKIRSARSSQGLAKASASKEPPFDCHRAKISANNRAYSLFRCRLAVESGKNSCYRPKADLWLRLKSIHPAFSRDRMISSTEIACPRLSPPPVWKSPL